MIASIVIMLLLLNIDISLNDAIDSTLESIVEAERAGANTTELIDRFNKVLSTLENCQECIDTSKDLLIDIENDAKDLKKKSVEANRLNILLAYTVYAPLAAFIITISSLYLYDRLQIYKTQQFKNMKVKRKDE